MKLLSKAVVISLIGAAITTAAAGYFVFTFTRSALQTTVREKQIELGRQTMDKLDRLLFGYYVGIQSIAEEEHIERALGGELTDPRVLERRMEELPFLTGPWDVLFVVNGDGKIVASTISEEIGKAVEEEPFGKVAYESAMRGNVYYSDSLLSDDTGKPTMIFAAPIRDQDKPNHPIVGAVLGHLAWPIISELIGNFDPSTEFGLYTHDGMLIATNQDTPELVFVKNAANTQRFNAMIASEREGDGEDAEALVTRTPSVGYLTYKGHRWSLFIRTPSAVAYSAATQSAWKIVLLIFPIILFSSFLSLLFLARIIIAPIIELTKVTKTISGGFLAERATITTKDELGELASSFNTMADNLRESVQTLRLEKDKIAKLIGSMGDGVMAIDKERKIILWNDAAALLTGWSAEESFGKPFKEILRLVREKDRTGAGDFIDDVITENRKNTMENHILLIRKDGTEVPVADSAAPIVDEDGQVRGAIVVFRDVTREREVEDIKSDFVAIASHEMRSPLTLIKGNAERLLRAASKTKDKKQLEMLSSIHRNSDRLFNIVNDFLDVISLEAKKIPFAKDQFDAAALVRETVADFQKIARRKKIHVRLQQAASLPMAVADANRTKQVVVNLVSNAVHHTEKGGIDITIKDEDGFLKISVADSGTGVAKKQQDSLFKKFSTIQKSFMHTKEYGSGLGLYISKMVVESMGGKIWLEKSVVGEGSVFSFTLPALRPKEDSSSSDYSA